MQCRDLSEPYVVHRTIFEYWGVVRDLVHQYKFKGCASVAHLFAPYLFQLWKRNYHSIPIVPVPSAPHNIQKRGWDQVTLLLRAMRRSGTVPSLSVIKRTRQRSQKELSRAQRLENAPRLFTLKRAGALPPHVVLLDDIYTTGATLEACANLLRSHGVRRVHGLTVAMDI